MIRAPRVGALDRRCQQTVLVPCRHPDDEAARHNTRHTKQLAHRIFLHLLLKRERRRDYIKSESTPKLHPDPGSIPAIYGWRHRWIYDVP